MSSTGDESSVFFSMHSRPVTRASTVASSLLPPMTEMGPSKYPETDKTGLRRLNTSIRAQDAISVGSGSSKSVGKHTRSRSPLEYGPEPFEEYCSPTRSVTSGLNDLQRNRSAKQLISRYEAMEVSAVPNRAPRTPVRLTTVASPAPVGTSQDLYSGAKNKKSSPIRHSFRNFLSVFTKTKNLNKEEAVWTPTTERTNIIRLMTPPTSSEDPFVVPNIITKNLAIQDQVACNTPTALRSGPLLYLSRCFTNPLASPILPVWTSCTATLHRKHMLITWLSPHGNPSTHIVDLATCTKVCSLALSQINSDEQALLPDKGADLMVFQLQFENTQKEKFAAPSVQQRAGWVSAIWDAILQTQDTEGEKPSNKSSSPVPGTLKIMTDLPVPCRSGTTPVYGMRDMQSTPSTLRTHTGTSIYSSIYSDRSLPPTPTSLIATRPESTSPIRLALHDAPRGRSFLSSATSHTGSPVHLSPSIARSSKSLSIANLDHLSVVKQRLAQIEQDPSRSSSPTISSPSHSRKSTRARGLSPLTPTRGKPTSPNPGNLRRLENLRNNAGSSVPFSCPTSPTRNIQGSKQVSRTKSGYTAAHNSFDPSSPMYASDQQRARADQESNGGDMVSPLAEHHRDEAFREGMAAGELKDIQDKLDDIRRQVNSQFTNPRIGIVQTLAEMQAQLKSDLPEMVARLKEIIVSREDGDLIKDSNPGNILSNVGASNDAVASPLDLSDVHAKLDNLLSMRKLDEDVRGKIVISSSMQAERDLRSAQALELSTQINELLGRTRSAEGHQVLQIEQQADSARYLNELNTWLETFVNGGTSQIQVVADSVQQLCEELGCSKQSTQSPRVFSDVGHRTNLLADIRQLLEENKNRDQNIEALQGTVNGLVDVVHENVRQNAEARKGMTIESIVDMINRQRHEYDHTLKALSTKLTDEIRGERLRFVDAMKEATEINVQAHVEQFKKELTREVLLMTQDVGRLHKERQAIEQQIADLFAFYSKQKQSSTPPAMRRGPSQPLAQRQQNTVGPPPITSSGRRSSQRRPLPDLLNPWNQ